MRKIKFGILSFAHIHAWNYAQVLKKLESAELVAIFDDDKERLARASSAYNVKDTYLNYHDLLKRDDIDAVIVTSENARHKEHVIAAAERNKHVIVEKPIATNLRDADEIISAAKKYGIKLQVAFVMRYHDASLHIKELIDKGDLGKILSIMSTNHGKYPGGWFGDPDLAGGGAIMDHTVHVADLMRWYTGDEVEEVYAVTGLNIRNYLKVEDVGLISLKFKRGIIGSIDCSWSRPDTWPIWGDVYMAVYGSEGYAIVDAFISNVTLVKEGKPLEWRYFGPDADLNMIEDFIKAIKEDREPRATGYDGRQALEIALAAYDSIRKGEIVKLPLS